MVPHSEPVSTLATARSSVATRLGTAAAAAGSKKAPSDWINPTNRNASHTVDGDRTKKNPKASTPRARSAATMSRRRSKRSASGPPTKVNAAKGTDIVAMRAATRAGEPVNSKTSPNKATDRNQSPPSEISCARNMSRKSRLRCSSSRASPVRLRRAPEAAAAAGGGMRPRLAGLPGRWCLSLTGQARSSQWDTQGVKDKGRTGPGTSSLGPLWIVLAVAGLGGLFVSSVVVFAEWLSVPWLALIDVPAHASPWLVPTYVTSATALVTGLAGLT